MKVAACAEGGAVLIETRPRPEPGSGEIVLRLRVAGLCGTDLFKLRHGTAPSGAVLGHEIVGTVAAVGEKTLGFAPGDRVAVPHHVACGACDDCRRGSEPLCAAFQENLLVPGGFSEWILVRERAVRRAAFGFPDHVSDEAAVFLEPAACVLRGIRQARIDRFPVGSATVLGAGSMGLLHLLVLKAAFPSLSVVVCDPLVERLRMARQLGADLAVLPQDAQPGADVVFDTAGGAAALSTALRLARPGGTVVLFAHGDAGEQARFDLNSFFKRESQLIATYSSSLAEQTEIHRLLVTGRLDPSPLVTHRLPLSRFADAVALARERRALKVLLLPDGEEAV